MKSDQELQKEGFTNSGRARYQSTVSEFCDTLFAKAVALGDSDKAADTPREVTHEHVRDAADSISRRRRDLPTNLQIGCQVGEYVCAAGAGVGAGKLDHAWGIGVFVVSVAIGVILFIVRSNNQRR